MSGEVETLKDFEKDPAGFAKRWMRELELSGEHEKKWRERAEKIVKRYRDEDRSSDSDTQQAGRFNILFANTEVLQGVMYQRTPVPDVRRRFLDKSPVARQAAQILQRALSFSVDAYDFDGVMRMAVQDVLLPGRGQACVKYSPLMQDGQVAYQSVDCDYVEWEMFRMSPAKRWSKVRWVAFGELMTRSDLEGAFGDKGKLCKLDWAPKDKENETEDFFKRALVWKVWDKTSRQVVFVSAGYTEGPLNVVTDPLGLEGFFPCPPPVYSVWTTDTMIPVPEFTQYQDQAIELDNITGRIEHLIDGLRRRGLYDATYTELEKLKTAGDNEFIPVENFANLAAKGGINNAIYEEPIDLIAKVLQGLYVQREQIKQTIYEITGIADILRGSTKSDETLGAQQLKARYANVRVGPRQKAIEMFARNLIRLKAEIIAEKFEPTVLKLMTGEELWQIDQTMPDGTVQKVDATEQIMAILRSDKLRGFSVDVETDSTVQADAAEEQKNRTELLQGITAFISGIGPAVQGGAIPLQFAIELLSWALRAFKVGPQLEEAIDRLGQQKQQAPAAPGAPSPEQQQAEGVVAGAQAMEAQAKAEEAQQRARKAKAEADKAEFELSIAMQGGVMAPAVV